MYYKSSMCLKITSRKKKMQHATYTLITGGQKAVAMID